MIACTSRAAAVRLLGIPFASGRNESSTPAAMVAAAKISGSRSAAPAIRREPRAPGMRPARAVRAVRAPRRASRPPGSQRIAASGSRPTTAAIAAAAVARWCPASQTPAGSATMAGTPETMPSRPSPSPRRPGGSSLAVSAPVTTPHKPKPSPRTRLTLTMTAWGWRASMARAGAPSRTTPAASTVRQPSRLIAGGATASAATVPNSRDPVISPAPELPAPPAAASIGITDSSRKKLVSEVNSARKVTASGTLRSRAGIAVSGCACVKALIASRPRRFGGLPACAPDLHRQVEIPPGQSWHGRQAELGPVHADGGGGGEGLAGRGHLADRQADRPGDLAHGERPVDGPAVGGDQPVPEGDDREPVSVQELGRQHALVTLPVPGSEARRVDLGVNGRLGQRLGDVRGAGPDRERAPDGTEPEHVPGAECHPRLAGIDLVAA